VSVDYVLSCRLIASSDPVNLGIRVTNADKITHTVCLVRQLQKNKNFKTQLLEIFDFHVLVSIW
jgi:hypothetical protein